MVALTWTRDDDEFQILMLAELANIVQHFELKESGTVGRVGPEVMDQDSTTGAMQTLS
jgi:hypothetical protein